MNLRIEKCVYGGDGLARAEGKTVFVPFTLPGELVEARIIEDRKSFARAEADAVLEPSPERTAAPCEYFGRCGGCHYQHAAYPEQVAIKTGILHESLQRARLATIPKILPVYAEPLSYRNRVRLHIQQEPFALCYKRGSSHANLPVDHCPIAAPVLQQAIQVVTRIGGRFLSECSEIEFFTNENQSELLVSLWTRQNMRSSALHEFSEALKAEMPVVSGAAVFHAGDTRQPEAKIAEWGAPSLSYSVNGNAYKVSAGSFFQANRFLVDRLLQLVTDEASGRLAWDLYAGVGLFARALARRFERVVAVEGAPSSASDLRQNLQGDGHKALQSGTLEFLQRQHRDTPDLIVVDPPRSGLGSKTVSLLTKVRAARIIYVSCDPATLSRDLHALVESGYYLSSLHMVDMFPHTFHLESVAALSLR